VTQILSAKIGAITGLTLAEMNRYYLPRWLNIGLWIIAEATIICTDVGQVRTRPIRGRHAHAARSLGQQSR
jgi:Mn2+/Fe2+ NRAMP family transporter